MNVVKEGRLLRLLVSVLRFRTLTATHEEERHGREIVLYVLQFIKFLKKDRYT